MAAAATPAGSGRQWPGSGARSSALSSDGEALPADDRSNPNRKRDKKDKITGSLICPIASRCQLSMQSCNSSSRWPHFRCSRNPRRRRSKRRTSPIPPIPSRLPPTFCLRRKDVGVRTGVRGQAQDERLPLLSRRCPVVESLALFRWRRGLNTSLVPADPGSAHAGGRALRCIDARSLAQRLALGLDQSFAYTKTLHLRSTPSLFPYTFALVAWEFGRRICPLHRHPAKRILAFTQEGQGRGGPVECAVRCVLRPDRRRRSLHGRWSCILQCRRMPKVMAP